MPTDITIEYDHFDRLIAGAEGAVGDATEEIAGLIADDAKVTVHKVTSNLANSIQSGRVAVMSSEVTVGMDYGAAHEYGTGVHTTDPDAPHEPIVIRPKNKRALFWPGLAHPVGQVIQQGQHPHPFLTPAVERNRDELPRAVERNFARLLHG